MPKTREEKSAYMREWRVKHPEYQQKQKEHFVTFKAEHPNYFKEYSKKWKKEHPEKVKTYSRDYREKNIKKHRESNRNYRKHHPEVTRQNRSKYRKTHRKKEDNVKKRARDRAEKIPLDPKCSECGATMNLEHHHLSYENDITITLCQKCHDKTHLGDPCYKRKD